MTFQMDLRTAASISLILLAVSFGIAMVWHEISDQTNGLKYRLVSGDKIEEAGPMVAGENEFWVKRELRSWGECLKPFFPLAIAVLAWMAKGKRKEKNEG